MKKLGWPALYLALIVFCNWLIVITPMINIAGNLIPPVMLVVGFVFVFRDLAQRAIGHYVLVAMILAAILSYWLASPTVALASASAFLISETIDWIVYTITKRKLSDRILISSIYSVPADTAIFLLILGIFNWPGMIIITALKFSSSILSWILIQSFSKPNKETI